MIFDKACNYLALQQRDVLKKKKKLKNILKIGEKKTEMVITMAYRFVNPLTRVGTLENF